MSKRHAARSDAQPALTSQARRDALEVALETARSIAENEEELGATRVAAANLLARLSLSPDLVASDEPPLAELTREQLDREILRLETELARGQAEEAREVDGGGHGIFG